LSAVSIKHGLARIWLQPSARLPERRLPAAATDPADESRNYLHHVVAQVAVSAIRPVFQDNRESNAGKLHESEMADPSYRRAFDDASSRRRLIDFLAECRAQRGMSQTRLARATGMSQSAISEFEKGVSEPRIASVQRWARAFGLRFELQLWEGPFVLFDSWIGRNLLYDSVVASVALNDQMANEWCEYWRRAQDSELDTGSPIAVGHTIVEPTSQDPSTRGRYLRELVSALSTEVK
jgi:transcriptional regulator with XRE-family HTH domain